MEMVNGQTRLRAWNIKKKEFEFMLIVDGHSILTTLPVPGAGQWDDLGPFQIATGLTDKNKKDIYVGDIVRYDWNWDYEEGHLGNYDNRLFLKATNKHKPYIGQVEWHQKEYSSFVINGTSKGHTRLNLQIPLMLVEIIGNIHETPELLKQTYVSISTKT